MVLLEQKIVDVLGPLLNIGAVGACLIVLGIYYAKKDRKYAQSVEEHLKSSENFRREQSELHERYQKELKEIIEKYRLALEKFEETLDAVINILGRRRGEL